MKRMITALALLSLPLAARGQTPEDRLEAATARVSAAGIPVASGRVVVPALVRARPHRRWVWGYLRAAHC
jgi:hypothetical protein